MIRAALDRALLAVHGQPDAWETPYCSGADCRQGDAPQACDCRTCLVADEPESRWRDARTGYVLHPDLHRVTLTELDLEIAPSDARVITPPARRAALPDPMKRRRLTRAAATAAMALVAFGLLCLWGSHQAQAATTVVLVGRP